MALSYAPVMITVIDAHGHIVFQNGRCAALLMCKAAACFLLCMATPCYQFARPNWLPVWKRMLELLLALPAATAMPKLQNERHEESVHSVCTRAATCTVGSMVLRMRMGATTLCFRQLARTKALQVLTINKLVAQV
eukprot:scaffold101776_cov29-Tisochrysis_lutea.AAC.2